MADEKTVNQQRTSASIVLTIDDLKRISRTLDVPPSALLSIIFDNDSELGLKSEAGPGGYHPRLLSVVPSNLEQLLNDKEKDKK